jgi:predicted TIM-barrel fold metal-dependent hydrolase
MAFLINQLALYRRQVLRFALGGLASPLLLSCAATLGPGRAVRSGAGHSLLVDVHCHVFNASDLPVRGFVQRVVFGDEEEQVVLGPEARAVLPWIGSVLIELLGDRAKTAEEELAEMAQAQRRSLPARTANVTDDTDEVARALQAVLSETPAVRRTLRLSDMPRDLRGRGTLLRRMAEEAHLDPQQVDLSSAAGARELARGLLVGQDGVSRHIQWAQELTRDRREIVSRLVALYAPSAAVSLFTPALIDFSGWLEDEPRSSLTSQIRVMERIQRQQTGPAVHCFAPFDPWRQIMDVEAGERTTALQLVQWAIEEMGFIGVKLYPPMGFLPVGNALVRQTYPERVAGIRDFPAKLDRALMDLYAYAEREGVPVMAHATDSNGAAPGYARRAHPRAWESVLQAYPHLRLNLGHFGDFEEARGTVPGEAWEAVIGGLFSEAGASTLYADLSYLAELLPDRDPTVATQIRQLLADFIQQYDAALQHLMYGSDWLMLGRERGYEGYAAALREEMGRILGDERRLHNFLGGNAVRYLGLRPGEPARRRLEAYYARNRLDATWLERIDTL